MVSINEISVKAVKKFLGHEGETCHQGNLYVSNRKVGFWTESSTGGGIIFNLNAPYSEKMLNDNVKQLNKEKTKTYKSPDGSSYSIEYDLNFLIYDLLKLTEDEKAFRKALKAGYSGILIVSDGYHEITWHLPENYMNGTDEEILTRISEMIEKSKKEEGFFKETDEKKNETRLYRSLSDFNIGEPIRLDDIKKEETI